MLLSYGSPEPKAIAFLERSSRSKTHPVKNPAIDGNWQITFDRSSNTENSAQPFCLAENVRPEADDFKSRQI